MKRTILALAIAGLSFSASALPPPGASTPLNVTVTNPTLDVSVTGQPLTVTPIEPFTPLINIPSGGTYRSTSAGTDQTGLTYLDPALDIVLQGFYLDLDATSSTKDGTICTAYLTIEFPNDSWTVLHATLVQSGARDGNYVPLPNIYVPAVPEHRLKLSVENHGDQRCYGMVQFRYVYQR